MVSPENGNEGDVQGAQQIVQEGPAQQREATPASNEGASTRSRRSSKKSSAAAVGGAKQEGEVAEAPAAIGTPVNPETGTTTAAPAVAEEKRRGCCAGFLHRCKHPREKHCCQNNGTAASTAGQSASGSVGAGGVPVAGVGTQEQR